MMNRAGRNVVIISPGTQNVICRTRSMQFESYARDWVTLRKHFSEALVMQSVPESPQWHRWQQAGKPWCKGNAKVVYGTWERFSQGTKLMWMHIRRQRTRLCQVPLFHDKVNATRFENRWCIGQSQAPPTTLVWLLAVMTKHACQTKLRIELKTHKVQNRKWGTNMRPCNSTWTLRKRRRRGDQRQQHENKNWCCVSWFVVMACRHGKKRELGHDLLTDTDWSCHKFSTTAEQAAYNDSGYRRSETWLHGRVNESWFLLWDNDRNWANYIRTTVH